MLFFKAINIKAIRKSFYIYLKFIIKENKKDYI
jgi:hypothetical protein